MSVAITVDSLSKRYFIGRASRQSDRLTERLTTATRAPFRRAAALLRGHATGVAGLDDTLWALREISFSMEHGESLGIIGRNGAGKSTLLKILCGITEPTHGTAELRGRVGSLLEIGTGFHPDLTGRENIYLSSAIMGMKRNEIDRKLDEIVAFADLEPFLETPVKHYSSGMYMRLGFAVAAHLEPEILLIDEVLAVGDADFQKKCLGRMEEITDCGRTIVFVSHNLLAIEEVCDRVIWLDQGRIKLEGPSRQIIAAYAQSSYSESNERRWSDVDDAPGNDHVVLRRVAVLPSENKDSSMLTVRDPFTVEVDYWNLRPGARLNMNLQLFNEQGVLVFEAGPISEPVWRSLERGVYRDSCLIPGDLLNDGTYVISLYGVLEKDGLVFRARDLLYFKVHDSPDMRSGWHGKWEGVVRPMLEWRKAKIGNSIGDPDYEASEPRGL